MESLKRSRAEDETMNDPMDLSSTGGSQNFVGQSLLNELQLPDRSVAFSHSPAPELGMLHGAAKTRRLFRNQTAHFTPSNLKVPQASLEKAEDPGNLIKAEKLRKKECQSRRRQKKAEKKQRERGTTAAPSGPKIHDHGVWQVPDVAFCENGKSMPITTSNEDWASLKAKALASKSKPVESVKQVDGGNEATNETSDTRAIEKPNAAWSDLKSKALASMMAHKQAIGKGIDMPSVDDNRPQANTVSADSVGPGRGKKKKKNKQAQSQSRKDDLSSLKAKARESVRGGPKEDSIGRRVKETSPKRVEDLRASTKPKEEGGDFYRPKTENRDRPRRPARSQELQTGAHAREDVNQYQGLGQGIWPVEAAEKTFSTNSPLPFNIENSFGKMFLGQPPNQSANVYNNLPQEQFGNVYNNFQHANQGFNPMFGTTGFSPFVNNTWISGAGTWINPFAQIQPNWTQTSSLHTSGPNNLNAFHPTPMLDAQTRATKNPTHFRRDAVIPSVAPKPSNLYLKQASNPPHRMTRPQPLLVISDLNGTLISRKQNGNFRAFKPRPGLSSFLANFLDINLTEPLNATSPPTEPSTVAHAARKNHKLMIWTSARPETTAHIASTLFSPRERAGIVMIWARDKLQLNPEQYAGKTQVYKRLETVWRDRGIQITHPHYARGERWSQRNTVLVDDSMLKGSSEPFNLVNVPELTPEALKRELANAGGERPARSGQHATRGGGGGRGPQQQSKKQVVDDANDDDDDDMEDGEITSSPGVLRLVADYIDEARWYADVSAFMRANPFKIEYGSAVAGRGEGGGISDNEDVDDLSDMDEDGDAARGGMAGVPLGDGSGSGSGAGKADGDARQAATFRIPGLMETHRD